LSNIIPDDHANLYSPWLLHESTFSIYLNSAYRCRLPTIMFHHRAKDDLTIGFFPFPSLD
jgi:hypothetical protein